MAKDIQPITGTSAKVAARLCNFPTAQAGLLPAHITFLENEVAPVIRNMQGPWVDLFGYASRRGDANFNMALSGRRIDSVKERISHYGKTINFQIQKRFGETESGPIESDNSGYWRAVEVYVYAQKPQRPPPPQLITSTQFEIRVVGGGSASALIQADNYFFQIVDLVRRQTAFYFYTGVGLGVSIPKLPGPGSVTKMGPPTKFRTTRSVELYQFNSRAFLVQDPGATIGSASIGGTLRLEIDDIQDSTGRIFTSPHTIPIEGGSGIQMPGLGSASGGVLAFTGTIYPFTGY
jgi:hypothetical protein